MKNSRGRRENIPLQKAAALFLILRGLRWISEVGDDGWRRFFGWRVPVPSQRRCYVPLQIGAASHPDRCGAMGRVAMARYFALGQAEQPSPKGALSPAGGVYCLGK